MFLMKAMRYYRLWIYTCNAVLFISILAFCAAGSLILSDNRRQLLHSVQLYQPSFLYAYLAIFMQGGVIQVMGFVAALRLNEKLLNAYWISLLVLLIGDILIGGVWMIKFDTITENLTSDLQRRLSSEYVAKSGNQFRPIFDHLQKNSQCCGVVSPLDYNATFWQMTETEFFLDYERQFLNTSLDNDHIDVEVTDDDQDLSAIMENHEHEEELDSEDLLLPWSCCNAEFLAQVQEPEALANTIRRRLMDKSQGDNKDPKDPVIPYLKRKVQIHTLRKKGGKEFNEEEPIWESEKWCIFSPNPMAAWHYHGGCSEPLKDWVRQSGDTLFVIGFCVIAFLKMTFLGILHYEIKEMIQKIQMLQKESQEMNGDLLRLEGVVVSSSEDCHQHHHHQMPVGTLVTSHTDNKQLLNHAGSANSRQTAI